MATHKGKLTARRLVITFVPTTGGKLEDSRRAGAVTQVPSESSHRTRSIAAMTAGSSPAARRAWASSASTPSLDVDYADSGSCRLHISLSVAKVQRAAD